MTEPLSVFPKVLNCLEMKFNRQFVQTDSVDNILLLVSLHFSFTLFQYFMHHIFSSLTHHLVLHKECHDLCHLSDDITDVTGVTTTPHTSTPRVLRSEVHAKDDIANEM